MNIIPQFNINRSFKDCPTGSIVGAKNIKVDETGKYIIPEEGFSFINIKENIIGTIPTPSDLYVFTDESNIYKVDENKKVSIMNNHNWKYIVLTKFIGTYTYIGNSKLCLVVSQYRDEDSDYIDYSQYPLQSWIVEDNNLSNYNICPDIPIFNCNYEINETGNLIAGVYTFFIRFKISNHDYTNWFQLTGDINIGSKIEHEIINHNYKIQNTIQQADTIFFDKFNVNKIGHTNKNIELSIDLSDTDILYKDYQIGAIVKIEESIVGRIFVDTENENKGKNVFDIRNNDFIEEVSIDDLTKNPVNYFNVKALCNYNNRLYIANYRENKIKNITVDSFATLTYKEQTFVKDKYDINTDAKNYDCAIVNLNFQINSASIKNIKKEVKIVPVTSGHYKDWYKICDPESKDSQSEVNSFLKYIADNIYIQNSKNGSYEPLSQYNINKEGEGKYDETGNLIEQKYVRTSYSMFIGNTFNDAIAIIQNSCWPGRELNNENDEFVNILYKIEGDVPCTPTPLYGRDGSTFGFQNVGSEFDIQSLSESTTDKGKEWINIYISKTGKIAIFDSRYAKTDNSVDSDYVKSNVYPYLPFDLPSTNESESDLMVSNSKACEIHTQGYNGGWGTYRMEIVYNEHTFILKRHEYINQSTHELTGHYTAITANGGSFYEIPKEDKNGDYTSRSYADTSHHLWTTNIYGTGKIALARNSSSPSPANGISLNRTLIPGQKYNTYIHFIRKDGSFTLGYQIANDFDNSKADGTIKSVYVKINENQKIPNKYKGFFITYEKPIKNMEWLIETKYDNKVVATNSDMIYNDKLIYTDNPKIEKFVYNKLGQNYVETDLDVSDLKNDVDILYGQINNINYKNVKYKTLYRLTPNIYGDEYVGNEYCPGYYNKEKAILFDKPVLFASDSETVCNMDETEVNYGVSMIQDYVYSDIPIDQFVVQKDFETRAMTFTKNGSSDYLGTYTNNVLSPTKLKDFLAMPGCYIAPPSKIYTNYVEDDYKDYFPQTIRRSDQIGDESSINSFRLFSSDEYRNIFENKGEIVNIFGSGNSLIIHCKYGMFKYNSSNNLTSDATTKKVDIFYNGYEDCFPDKVGYGGLDNKDECLLCKAGYIWFDKKNKTILILNEKINVLSDDLDIFLKKLPEISRIRFAYTQDKRILICINYNSISITISYNLNTKTLISTHSYKIYDSYNTYNETFFILSDAKYLMYFDRLSNNGSPHLYPLLFPDYSTNETNHTSYIDIVFSENYEMIKCLDSINYSLYKNKDNESIFDTTDSKSVFSGNGMIIYSDSSYSGILNINSDSLENSNSITNYNKPYYQKGQWCLNYFRNHFNNDLSNSITEKNCYLIYKKNNMYLISEFNINNQQIQKFATNPNDKKDKEPRLIYGKYFVVRFIFTTNDYILENVSFNVSPY